MTGKTNPMPTSRSSIEMLDAESCGNVSMKWGEELQGKGKSKAIFLYEMLDRKREEDRTH